MQSSAAPISVTELQLEQYLEKANGYLRKVAWIPKPGIVPTEQAESQRMKVWRESSSAGSNSQEESLAVIGREISKDPFLLLEEVNKSLGVVRKGLQIGMHLSALYTKSSGLDLLIEQNSRSRAQLEGNQPVEFRGKYTVAAAISVFACASYIVWDLSRFKMEEVGSIALDFGGIPEIALRSPVDAYSCMCYYYAAYLKKSGVVHTGLDFVKLTLLYFRAMADEIKMREGSFQYKESFTENIYKLEKNEFLVNGFNELRNGSEISVEFRRVRFEDIVGNRDAKHKAQRMAERLICYDPKSKKNPFLELGGLPTLRLGRGKPGTGKSMQIAATATTLSEYCQKLEIPFLFWPLPDTIVSTFQGGSAERMMDWFRVLRDPSKIIYAAIDDAENIFEDRTRQGVSAGVREVEGVFLRNTEGAYAINHGNFVIEMFTNIPDQVDKAILSRVMDRMDIDGAETREDFLDQDHLWMNKYLSVDPHFVNMQDPRGYVYLSSQRRVKSLSQVYEGMKEAKEANIHRIYERVLRSHKVTDQDFFAKFFVEMQEDYPFFSSRDVRNIQSAVDTRVMDFDLPEEWLEHPEMFYRKEYDEKKNMLVELMRTNMKGLSFAEIRLQETIRYVETTVRIMETGREREIAALIEQLLIKEEAIKRSHGIQTKS